MKSKIIILASVILSICISNASGLYIVSGGDFRPCNIKYKVVTTNANQTVLISPIMVALMRNWGNDNYAGPWSIKTLGQEFHYSQYENIAYPYLGGSCVNSHTTNFTYAIPGEYLVKIYDEKSNLYSVQISNPDLTELVVDFISPGLSKMYNKSFNISILNCPKARSIFLGLPTGKNQTLSVFGNMSSLTNIVISNPERYSSITQGTLGNTSVTNDIILPNVTTIGNRAFASSPKIKRLDIPNATSIGSQVASYIPTSPSGAWFKSSLIANGNGLRTLTIGDGITAIDNSAFYGQTAIQDIRFVTTDDGTDSWVDTWNNHPKLKYYFGEASNPVNGVATLTQLTTAPDPAPYPYMNDARRPAAERLILVPKSE